MQLNEKTMVADTLTGINGELVRFGEMIAQTENSELNPTLKQFRNACEQSQEAPRVGLPLAPPYNPVNSG